MSSPEFRQFWECISDVVLAVDRAGRVIDASRQVQETFGYAEERLRGVPLEHLLSPLPFNTECFDARFLHANGTWIPVRGRWKAWPEGLFFSEPVVIYALTTASVAASDTVRDERFRAMEYLSSRMVHDVSNVLTPILGYTELLLMFPSVLDDAEKSRQYLQSINNAAQQLSGLLLRMREFYRKPAPTEPLKLVSLGELARSALGQALSGMQGIVWEAHLDGDALVEGSEGQLRQAIFELIANAAEAVATGGSLRVCVAEEGARVVLTVEDTGPGMPPEIRDRCIDPMFTTRGAAHTGLGLSIAYGVAKRHRGEVRIVSSPVQGTRVTLALPKAEAAQNSERS